MTSSPDVISGKHVLVLGGDPREAIDGVRHYANTRRPYNHGMRVAETLRALGMRATLVTANARPHASTAGFDVVETVGGRKITSTRDLLDACSIVDGADVDVVLQLANVPSIVAASQSPRKLKVKGQGEAAVQLEVMGNLDIDTELVRLFPEKAVCGYDRHQRWFSHNPGPLSDEIARIVEECRDLPPSQQAMREEDAASRAGHLNGRTAIVTSGPTVEAISTTGDVISNFSSGRQGHAVAEALADMGANVTLVSGPTNLARPVHEGIHVVDVTTAREMYVAVMSALPADIFVGVAAVADFYLPYPTEHRLRSGETITLRPAQSLDILQAVGTHDTLRPSVVVGFAAETHDILHYARGKLESKGADFICANEVGQAMTQRHSDTNDIVFVSSAGHEDLIGHSKKQVGTAIGMKIVDLLNQKA